MKSLAVAAAFAATSLFHVADATADAPGDAPEWLRRIHAATERLTYRGTFVYQHGEDVETSRITRVVDADGVHERLETLDGTPREIIRVNDEVKCYLPATMTVKVERGVSAKPFALRGANVAQIAELYDLRKGGVERIADRDCQAVILVPKDTLRYGHKFCADVESGLLVAAKTFDGRGRMVERFAFTQLAIGGPIDRALLRSRYTGSGGDWRIEDHAAAAVDLAVLGWVLGARPTGFQRVTTLKRDGGGGRTVGQVVVSDGLAAVSVFIEPFDARTASPQLGLSHRGAVSIYRRKVDDYLVTAVGEVPPESARLIASAIERRPAR